MSLLCGFPCSTVTALHYSLQLVMRGSQHFEVCVAESPSGVGTFLQMIVREGHRAQAGLRVLGRKRGVGRKGMLGGTVFSLWLCIANMSGAGRMELVMLSSDPKEICIA